MRGFECPKCGSNVLEIFYEKAQVTCIVTRVDSPTFMTTTGGDIVSRGEPSGYRCGCCDTIVNLTQKELSALWRDSLAANRDWKAAYVSETEAFKRFRDRVADILRRACPIVAHGVEISEHHVKNDVDDLPDVIQMLVAESDEQRQRAVNAESKLNAIRHGLAEVLDKGPQS